MQLFINNWASRLASPLASASLTMLVPAEDAARLVGLGSGDHYLLTLAAVDVAGVETAHEIVKVTADVSGSLTIERAQEGTTAAEWPISTIIEARLTAGGISAIRDAGMPGDLAAVATSGDYTDLINKPPIPSTAVEVGAIPSAEKGAALGVATLDAGSKIPLAQLPAAAITDTFVVNTEAAMLALDAQVGDVAIRPDITSSFILQVVPASVLGNWQQIITPSIGGGAPVGSATPQALGAASTGVSGNASREDHVHPMPSADAVGADAEGAAASAQAHAVQRDNHTGEQAISTVTGLQAALDKATFAPVITEATTARASAIGDAGSYIRFTNTGAKTYTVQPQASVAWVADSEIHGRNVGASSLTLTPGSGVTLNAPFGGTLVVPPGGSFTLKRGAENVWDVLGQTVAA
ncbi:hypothetical protein D3C78_395780 [compost metagenome]